jgi:hypothetical protein
MSLGTLSAIYTSSLLLLSLATPTGRVQAEPIAGLSFSSSSSALAVGGDLAVNVDLADVASLFGYQFVVHYDAAKVDATGAFVNTWFDTSAQAYIAWNADCSTPGTCKFAATKQIATGGEVNGTGTLARITFHGISPGFVPLTFDSDKLSDRDGFPITHTIGTATLAVYGFATFSGVVTLQGRPTPISAGTVTLSDAGGDFAPTLAHFDAETGAWSASVPVTISGSTYHLVAAHALYLTNQKLGELVTAGSTYPQPNTRLSGGDATNNGVINLGDLACIGGAFGDAPVPCGTEGSSDINADGTTDIYDLTLAGGNYEFTSPQAW